MSQLGIRVNAGKVNDLMKKLSNLQGFRTGARAAMVHLKSRIAIYPPRSSRPQAQYWTPAQRRGFFYHLNRGNIEVPYRRGLSPNSERLGQRWEVHGEGFGIVLGNSASYAPLVNGRNQAAYHRSTGHKRVDDVLKAERPRMNKIIFAGVQQDLKSIR